VTDVEGTLEETPSLPSPGVPREGKEAANGAVDNAPSPLPSPGVPGEGGNAAAVPDGQHRRSTYTTEKLIRLPGLAWVYDEPLEARAVGALPAERNGYVTFLCANNPLKVTPEALATWAKVLAAVPNSRLTMLLDEKGAFGELRAGAHGARKEKPAGESIEPRPTGSAGLEQDRPRAARAEDAGAGRWLREAFAGQGIDPARVNFAGRQSRGAYFAWIESADIALDPFPYNGGVTTCDTLWMGVPVVSLAGDSYWSRQGLALLSNVGLAELAAPTREAYADTAIALATDLPRLAEVRRGLRERMRQSAIIDAAGFARKLEAAYRQMWRERCGSDHP
jgi:predicted O-linked N-acetylglucosamine transferase (SPINDLY family)